MALMTDAGTLKLITCVRVTRNGRVLLIDYKDPPVSRKKGWWLQTPQFEYGDHPERALESALKELGLSGAPSRLLSVESLERGTGWHLIFHYQVEADREPEPIDTIRKVAWFGVHDMPPAEAFANNEQERQAALDCLAQSGGLLAPGTPALGADKPPPRRAPRVA